MCSTSRHPRATLLGVIAIAACCCGAAGAHGTGIGNGGGTGHAFDSHSNGSHGRGHRGARWYGHGGGRRPGVGGLRGWFVPDHGYFFASLPPYCTLVYWQGTGFYHADGIYYEWNGTAGGYQEVEPPPGLVQQVDGRQAVETDLFVFPVEGQTNAQLEADRAACDRWAVTQAGFDPHTAQSRDKAADGFAVQRDSYARADRLCLEARHYAVE